MTKRRIESSRSDRSKESSSAPSDEVSAVQKDEHSYPAEQVRLRAYEFYVERAENAGDEVTDWVRAEQEYFERSRDRLAEGETGHDSRDQDRL